MSWSEAKKIIHSIVDDTQMFTGTLYYPTSGTETTAIKMEGMSGYVKKISIPQAIRTPSDGYGYMYLDFYVDGNKIFWLNVYASSSNSGVKIIIDEMANYYIYKNADSSTGIFSKNNSTEINNNNHQAFIDIGGVIKFENSFEIKFRKGTNPKPYSVPIQVEAHIFDF